MKKGTLLLAMLLAGLLFANLSAKNGELVLKDGQVTVEGDITEKPDGYEVVVPGTMTPRVVTKDQVLGQPVYYETPAEGYDKKKAAIANDDKDYVRKMLALATWAMKHKLNEQMGDAAAAALAVDPTNIKAKLMLEASKKNSTTQPVLPPDLGPRTTPGPGIGPKPPIGPIAPTAKLADKDVNTIRLLEMTAGDRVPMTFKKQDLWQLILDLARDKTDPDLNGTAAYDKFAARRPDTFAQLSFAMAKISPDSYYRLADKVTMRSDPACLTPFKTRINPWLVQTCGTAGCHGGGNPATPFRLQSGKDDASIYTNFYVVSEFVGKSGRLLDRDRPDYSLIARFGLNPKLVDDKEQHPQVNGLPVTLGSPPFRDKNTPIYQLIMAWLTPSMGEDRKMEWLRTNDRVDYHIAFPASGITTGGAATQKDMMPINHAPLPVRPGSGFGPGQFQPANPRGVPGPWTPGGGLPPVNPRLGPGATPAPGGNVLPANPKNGPG